MTTPTEITLPNGVRLSAQPVDRITCDGCWFDERGGCIGLLDWQPGCGDLTRDDGQQIIWVTLNPDHLEDDLAMVCRCGPDGCADSVACPKGGAA